MTEALNHLNEAAEVHAAAGDDVALTANRAVRLRLAAQIERSQDRDPGSGASRSTAPADVDETRALLDRTPVTDRPTQHRLLAAYLGDLLAGLGRWAEAADAYVMALEAEERLVSAVITRAGRESTSGDRPVARNAAYVLARAGRLDDALVVLERGRARALSDRLGDDLAGPDGPGLARLREVDPDLADRYARARERLRDAQDADLSGSIGRRRERPGDPAGTSPRPTEESEDPSGLVEIARRTREATAELDALVSRIRGIDGFHGFRHPADLDMIHSAAEPGCPLVYLATTNWGTVTLVVVASREGPIVETVWSAFTDEEAYAVLMFPADRDSSRFPLGTGFLMRQEGLVETVFADGNAALTRGEAFGKGVVQRTGRDEDGGMWRLGERVVAPLADVLRRHDATDAVLVISGRLGEFPVHTAPLHRGEDAPCLLDTVDVAFAPSARVLLHCRTRARGFWPAPSFGGLADPRPHPTPLAFAEQETRRIALLFVQSTVRAGTDATRDAALSAFTSVSYVHLACHGGYELGDHSPHLEFEDAAEVHLADIIRERPFVSARLVTLSACQTAIPSARAGENDEVDGLPSGLLAAGTPAVVATLWPVDDLSTTLLMERFYAYQLYGDPALRAGPLLPHRALSRAQRWLARVTAGELADFFANQPSLRQDVENLPSGSRYPASTAARNAIRFGTRDPHERPFAESWFWGAFVLIGA